MIEVEVARSAAKGADKPTARVVEVFSSIQGEAELVGVRQIFLRFFGCNLRCGWCDSPETLTAPKGPLPAGAGGADARTRRLPPPCQPPRRWRRSSTRCFT
jgi:pyruvate-formate lyase-activating enzyme